MAASVCGTEADVLPTEERKYDHEMSTPLQWEQRAAAWSHQTPRIQNLAKALPLMSKGEEATFKIMVKNLCELAGPEVWRQTVDARQRSVLWHAVDVEDDAAVEILLAYGAGDDERTLQSCRALGPGRRGAAAARPAASRAAPRALRWTARRSSPSRRRRRPTRPRGAAASRRRRWTRQPVRRRSFQHFNKGSL